MAVCRSRPQNHLSHLVSKGPKRFAARARILYLVIPAFTIIVVLGIGFAISDEIADDSSRRLARQYSIEAAANFQTATSAHFVLMQQIARSTTISRWLSDENNPALRYAAFHEIMGYASFAPDLYVMFTVNDSLQGYNFSVDIAPEEFVPWGTLLEYPPEARQWFYEVRDAVPPFNLNIQGSRAAILTPYTWSNHRMYYRGHLAGVVTVGSPFASTFEAVFGGFDVNYRRGYIIDQNGAVRVDSARLLTVSTEYGLPAFPALPEADYNPALEEIINYHQQRLVRGAFPLGVHILDTIPLRGLYRYGSIAPITGTPWSVVVLSNHMGAFGEMRYNPLIFSAIALLVVSAVIGSTLVRHAVLDPLFFLTQSAAKAATITENADLFGLERNDEIGDLARTVQFMRTSLSSANAELKENAQVILQTQGDLQHRERLLNTINQAAEILLTANEKNTMEALMAGMEIVGRCLDVDRVQIWRNETMDGELYVAMQYEWVSEFGTQKVKTPIELKFSYSSRPGWLERFMRGESISGSVSKLSPVEAAFLSPYEIVSIVMLPLFLNNEFFGFFCVNDCRHERTFTEDEMRMFASAGLMFVSVFNRNVQRDLAMTDVLTGARNRRCLMETAEQELQGCIRRMRNFSVIIIDIDHFKSINDRYGHTSGDAVLKILTARVRHVLKHDTLLARYGGEEFVVTLPGVDLETAVKTAWRIQKAINASAFLIEGLVEINVTASFGVASKTSTCTILTDIIDRADKALYQAKNAGRNTVVGYSLS